MLAEQKIVVRICSDEGKDVRDGVSLLGPTRPLRLLTICGSLSAIHQVFIVEDSVSTYEENAV